MHTVWKGSISFGLVNIPIKLHAATESKDIQLRQLHKACNSPINYKKTCPVCDTEVGNEEIVKAYEYAKNKYVVLDAEELENLRKENEDKAVEIIEFVKLKEIDPIYFERSYFLAPDSGGKKAYALLREALSNSGKIGVAKITIRSKEQLAIVRVYHDTLLMETILFPDEVRNTAEIPNMPSTEKVTEEELDLALMLIEQLTVQFEPEKYTDDYRTALLELIEKKKAENATVTATEKETKLPSGMTELMAALQASLDKTSIKKKPTTRKRKTKPKKEA
ncbi:non-homologous end joining protein Ku [Lysinibacillus antri]|uniref:Non-homologous end joining protein Ku n=1 Tax=Lysinibacillus antri TaxID=2498145 RepID=A0A432LAU2_9BACI|nr:Ku protein [Lysinibacillus antri]RUL51741.1 Ku protein [Lysinibacillus antri]